MGAYASDVRQHDNGGENQDCRARRVRVGVGWALDKDGKVYSLYNTAVKAIALSDWDAMTNDGRMCGAEEMTTTSAAGSVGRREKSTDGWSADRGIDRLEWKGSGDMRCRECDEKVGGHARVGSSPQAIALPTQSMHAQTHLPWTSSSPPNAHSFRPPSEAYWRPPTATGLNRPDPPRGDYRPPPPGSNGGAGATSGQRGHQTMWRRAQEEARYVIKIEQDRLDRLFAAEAETLKRAEEALSHRRSRRSSEDPEYAERLLADEERRVQQERNRVNKLRADNTEWLSHLIKQETDRIHAAMIEDELEGRLTPEESQWLENNIQKRKAEEERQSMKRAQEEEAERLRKLEEEEAAAKLRAAQAEELAQAARLERFALPPIPDPEELSLALYSDPSSVDTATPDDDKAL
ncbi:hypothetical protein AG1IA_00777 [Rhizoctonia solani AG-1 IA]|uniref:Uncharacterized protein n=1 Tax=Thanatephorus cucumeris (strain AG1-IA) TaxID=983506 RepID=L8X7X4_THACA|nr:hypothetical protein AG1IA_00777 [Rhizoctonia solani AG-1 IA]